MDFIHLGFYPLLLATFFKVMLKFCLLQPNLAKQLPGHLSSGFSEPGIRLGPLWTSAHWHLTETLWRKCLQTNYTDEDMEAQGSWVTYLMAHSKKGGRAGIQRLSDQSLLSTLLPCPCHAPLWVCVCVCLPVCLSIFMDTASRGGEKISTTKRVWGICANNAWSCPGRNLLHIILVFA